MELHKVKSGRWRHAYSNGELWFEFAFPDEFHGAKRCISCGERIRSGWMREQDEYVICSAHVELAPREKK